MTTPAEEKDCMVWGVSVLFLIVALSLADCRTTRRETVATPVERVAVRLKWLHQAQFAGFYCAKELGFYRQKGLDVALEPGGAPDPTSPLPSPAIQMVSSGSEDFGVAGADQILLARDKGIPLVAVAVIYRKSPVCYFALKRSGITRPQDFVGKRVAVRLGGNEEVTYRAMMMKASVELLKPDDKPIGWMDASKWHELQDLLLEAGFLKSRQDVRNAFTTQFLDGT